MIKAKNKDELIAVLAGIDIAVPLRSQGRLDEHTERYAIAYLLSTLAQEGLLEYPLSLLKRERPDFELYLAGQTVGIEHTEAVAHNVAHSDFWREKGHGDDVYFIRKSDPGERRLSVKEILAEISNNDPGGPWIGDAVEREWNRVMSFFTRKKCESAKKDGYDLFATNALLIYDNWRLPVLQIEEAAEMFLRTCSEEGYFHTFQLIYIHSGSQLCRFSEFGVAFYDLNELWRKS